MSKQYNSEKQWYVIHTYVGYEEKVAEAIRQRADSLDMADKISNQTRSPLEFVGVFCHDHRRCDRQYHRYPFLWDDFL